MESLLDSGSQESNPTLVPPSQIETESNQTPAAQPPNPVPMETGLIEADNRPKSPLIQFHSGPPPKRNVALKNTSGGRSATLPKTIISASLSKQVIKNTGHDSDLDFDDNGPIKFDRDDSDEDFGSQSDDDFVIGSGLVKRRSNRTTKKPKMLDEFVIESDQRKQAQSIQSNQESQIKSKPTARKSTSNVTISRPPSNNTISTTLTQQSTSSQKSGGMVKGRGPAAIINGRSSTSVSTSTAVDQKQTKNKSSMCCPKMDSRAIQTKPSTCDQSTQLDNDDVEQLMRMSSRMQIVPVPVPVHVPLPMFMYQAPLPVPILIPIPIPVPVIIPTTKKTYDRVHRKIQKLRQKLPSDPNEFELLLYAEKLAREEGIAGFEESSDGESEPESSVSKKPARVGLKSTIDLTTEQFIDQDNSIAQQLQQQALNIHQVPETSSFKWSIGVKVFNSWLPTKLAAVLNGNSINSRQPNDLLKLTNEELNNYLGDFVNEVRKPSGDPYAPESVYYMCLGIQHYLQEASRRVDNIFLDGIFERFQAALDQIAVRYQVRVDDQGLVQSRIEEEILWETRQLGVHSPKKREQHKKLSFANVRKHVKKNVGPNGEDFGRTTFLRYYPEVQGHEQIIYEQCENYENPLRCPVELYNFYLSKCPESVKSRGDVFYLMPEKASLPTSPIWFSSQPVNDATLDRMLNRIKMVKEVNDWLMATTPVQ